MAPSPSDLKDKLLSKADLQNTLPSKEDIQSHISTARDLQNALPSSPEELKQDVSRTSAKAKSAASTQFRDLAAGGIGGICAVLVGHPFDLVKVRMQTAERGVYSSALDVARKTIARERLVRDLYAGVSVPLVGVTPMFMVSFWGYGVGKSLVEDVIAVRRAPDGTPQYSIAQISAAGFLAAMPMALITAPFERVKVLLQLQGQRTLKPGEKPQYSGGLDVVRQLYRTGGVRSVFRGLAMTLARDGPGSAAYFAAYEMVKRSLTPKDHNNDVTGELRLRAVIVAGGAAGVAVWISVFPIDTVKSRLQAAAEGGSDTIMGTIRRIYRNGGVGAFYPGFGPALTRAIPANAAAFLGVELAHRGMTELFG
ncbi:hypothetical protein GJ744_007386 [Endocarpon pusillum]|uniref:Mitochondrial thiamine pyrophosphate carrier 1 n=1 Tax=Endocarpon pusillum TaxID=364733 RepID=A0A8H7E653_9EURO|nr:hypothetical protein GJ744_007386 [Endocarpon pusillum]